VKWIQDYRDSSTELSLIGQKTWNDDEIKKRRFVQNSQNIGLVDTVFKLAISLHHVTSDLINRVRNTLQDRFTMLVSHPIEQRRTKSKIS
jgi:hypothetical protein